MARTTGSKNKAKLIGIKLSDLSRVFLPDTVIMVSAQYASTLNVAVSQLPTTVGVAATMPIEKEKIVSKDLSNFSII